MTNFSKAIFVQQRKSHCGIFLLFCFHSFVSPSCTFSKSGTISRNKPSFQNIFYCESIHKCFFRIFMGFSTIETIDQSTVLLIAHVVPMIRGTYFQPLSVIPVPESSVCNYLSMCSHVGSRLVSMLSLPRSLVEWLHHV